MNDYRVKIKQLYREIYNLCISNSVNEEQLLQIFGEAEKEILQNVDSTYIDNGMVMQTTSNDSSLVDKPLFDSQAVAVQSTVPVNNASQTVAPVATSTSSLTIDKPLFDSQAVPVQSTVPVNNNNISQQ